MDEVEFVIATTIAAIAGNNATFNVAIYEQDSAGRPTGPILATSDNRYIQMKAGRALKVAFKFTGANAIEMDADSALGGDYVAVLRISSPAADGFAVRGEIVDNYADGQIMTSDDGGSTWTLGDANISDAYMRVRIVTG